MIWFSILVVGLFFTIRLPMVHSDAMDRPDPETGIVAIGLKILVFSDDPVHLSPDSYVETALQELGLDYLFAGGDPDIFLDSLISGGPWDLIIFAHEVTNLPDADVYDALNDYVLNGDRAIIHSFTMIDTPYHQLWDSLGVAYAESITTPPREKAAPIYWWLFDHPVTSTPYEIVPFENLANPLEVEWPVEHGVTALESALALGGLATEPTEGVATLVLGHEEYTLFRGFVDFINEDYDAGIKLWINSIRYLLRPGVLTKSNPPNNTSSQPITQTLSWQDSAMADSYQYCIDKTNDDLCDGSWIGTGAQISITVTLDHQFIYYWQVQALNDYGTTLADSGIWSSFTTAEATTDPTVYLPLIVIKPEADFPDWAK